MTRLFSCDNGQPPVVRTLGTVPNAPHHRNKTFATCCIPTTYLGRACSSPRPLRLILSPSTDAVPPLVSYGVQLPPVSLSAACPAKCWLCCGLSPPFCSTGVLLRLRVSHTSPLLEFARVRLLHLLPLCRLRLMWWYSSGCGWWLSLSSAVAPTCWPRLFCSCGLLLLVPPPPRRGQRWRWLGGLALGL